MTRTELLQLAKPILFNTEMVQAILDGRKTVTRRVVKQKAIADVLSSPTRLENPNVSDKQFINCPCDAPYSVGDTLWVRETWRGDDIIGYEYKADGMPHKQPHNLLHWRPSIHMPKEAAWLFLRVTDVRVERLQDIMKSPYGPSNQIVREGCIYGPNFIAVWENTIKPIDRPHYGWNANPWVWAIEFERVEATP